MKKLALFLFLAACAADDMTSTSKPDDFGGEGSDAFGARPADPARVAQLEARAKDLIKPGSTMQIEPRLGVPTFLWAKPPLAKSSRARWVTANALHPEVDAARDAVRQYAPLYGLSNDDITFATTRVDARAGGPSIVKLRSQVGGIEVFREELDVLLDRNLDPISLSGYISGIATPPARTGAMDFALSPQAGAAAVIARMASLKIDAAMLAPMSQADGYDYYTLAANAGVTLEAPVRVKRVYFRLPDGLEAAYYVEVQAHTGDAPIDELSIDGGDKALEAYAYVVSASTGQLLFRKNLIENDVSYRVFADPATRIPLDTPSGNAVHPKPNPVPDGAQFPFLAPSDVTLNNFPFSQNDPWLAPGATETTGNNVEAFVNLVNAAGNVDNGFGPAGAAVDPATGDFHAQITGVDQFLHTNDPANNVGLAEGRQGAIQQLFYDINFLHDWYYDSGFNEAAGNAQTNNYGRGGLGNDSIKGQAQDTSTFSNANMLTPADGSRPRMRMYVFPSPANHLELLAPAAIAGKTTIGISQTGVQARTDVTTEIVRAQFSNSPSACTITNAAALDGKIALFDFDNTDGTGCAFSTRMTRISATNAAAIMMAYTSGNPTVVANITGLNTSHTKPIAVISWNARVGIQAQLDLPAPVTARLLRDHHFDGTVDNQIVFHEWMHYASNRLVGNATGLSSQQGGGMGEGWGDFNALTLTVRADDTATPSNATFNGAYALATHALGGVPFNGSANNNFYFGIRRYPYSTDMNINPLTFKHIENGVALPVGPPVGFGADGANNAEVHNTGEVWTTMLWECYAGILRDTLGSSPRLTFQEAQDRMKRYVIGGLKLTPVAPTFTEARDGVLAMALATDPADYVACKRGFTKRGAGTHAVSPDRNSATNSGVIEDFADGPDLAIESVTLDDSLGSCDSDGVVDHGEYGKLSVTVRNTGLVPLTDTTAIAATSSSGIWFPTGATLTFPALAPGATATASVRIALPPTSVGIAQADFQISASSPAIGVPVAQIASFRIDTDSIAASTATDTVESVPSVWTPTGALLDIAPFKRAELTPLDHEWHVDDPGAPSDQMLTSPVFTVDGSGSLTVQFDHAWSFEFDGAGNYDGAVVEMSVNGGAFTDIGGATYNGTILNANNGNPLRGRVGYVQTGSAHASITRVVAPGSTVQVRFRSGSDASISAGGWNIDNIAFSGVVETPFATLVAESDSCGQVPTAADLGITKTDGVSSVIAGGSTTYFITASNAGPDNVLGATVVDVLPSDLACTWTCIGGGGTCSAPSGTGNIVEHPDLPAGGSVTYIVSCTVSTTSSASTIANTATIANPGPVADPDPANNVSTDDDLLIHLPAHLFGSKTVAGTFTQGGTVTYTVLLGNDGVGTQFDNAGSEFTDVLPAGLTLQSASATSGTAVATIGTNTVTWDGSIAANGSVTISIIATIDAAAGTSISNQGTFKYDSDGNGSNETTGVTDAFQCD